MTDAELQTVREKLNPYFVPYAQKPKNYKHTSSKKTQPDMWVKDVSKSIVLQVRLLTQAVAKLEVVACAQCLDDSTVIPLQSVCISTHAARSAHIAYKPCVCQHV